MLLENTFSLVQTICQQSRTLVPFHVLCVDLTKAGQRFTSATWFDFLIKKTSQTKHYTTKSQPNQQQQPLSFSKTSESCFKADPDDHLVQKG